MSKFPQVPTMDTPPCPQCGLLLASMTFTLSCLPSVARSGPLWEPSRLCHPRLGEEGCWHPEGAFAETGFRLC